MLTIAPGAKADAVYHLIASRSQPLADRFRRRYQSTMFEHTTSDELEMLNRFWRHQLSKLNHDTISERECLCNTPDFQSWLLNFERFVLPTIMAHKLPACEI